ncbi:MAG: hypothetical protein NVSMB7_00900 [Chitinophagaceae bacterium]
MWNESHYVAGEIGKHISVARRNGTSWYMGNAAGLENWKENLSLDFLAPGIKYSATMYEDDEQGSIRKRTIVVRKGEFFPVDIQAKGGQAIMMVPFK